MKTPTVEPMTQLQADRVKLKYVCSGCWSELVIMPDKEHKGMYYALCLNCETKGYVTKSWKEKQTLEAAAKAHDAKINLKDAVPFLNPTAGLEVSEILKRLGF